MKLSGKWTITLVIAATLAATGFSIFAYSIFSSSGKAQTESVAPTLDPSSPGTISALGRLEPKGTVIKVAAPSGLGSSRVSKLLVKEGSLVKAGQVIAVMDMSDRLFASYLQAEAGVTEARSRLAQVQAGAKAGDIAAQQAVITRLEADTNGELAVQQATVARHQAEFRTAQREYERYQSLYRAGAISASLLDTKKLEMMTSEAQVKESEAAFQRTLRAAREQLKREKATLNSLAEVRPTDIQQAQAQVEVAIANLQRAKAELEDAAVRSPLTGQVIKVHTEPGEIVGSDGIVELGNTSQMYAIAEVYETDVSQVAVGQKATITSSAFPGTIAGIVEQVGLQIRKNDVLNTDPAADADVRVVEVKIRLANSQKVARLTNLQVKVTITP
ncbi:MAG: ABC exporter membrane fusion protein [Leptolyngbyaceae bacterium]|nr:ABC exporter membrane fusion protein [Leptolyngbyaceae bacterium]